MTVLHEARELYDAARDSVGRLTLTVEHAPGQLAALVQFLGGIGAQAGVYFAEIKHEVMDPPAPAAVAEPAVQEETKGEGDGERLFQYPDTEHQGAEVGQGREPEEAGSGAGEHADAEPSVAEPAGEVAVEGSGERGA